MLISHNKTEHDNINDDLQEDMFNSLCQSFDRFYK